jgi:hypothetical protein
MWGMPTPDRPKPARPQARATPPPLPGAVQPRPPIAGLQPAAEKPPDKPSYLKFAFANPYNLALVGGSLAAAVLTFNPLIALAGLGLEAIWLVNADNALLRRFVWDPKFERIRQAAEAAELSARIHSLNDWDRTRVENLVARQTDINRLAAQNPSFTGDLLRSELRKTDRLVEAFVDLALTSGRYEAYLASVDLPALDADRDRLERDVKLRKDDDPQLDLLKRNLAIILKRQDKMREIRRYLDLARGQLDLLENSFQLIADQIVTMQSPQALSGQLDELLDGVESIRQTAREADALLEA